MKRLLCALCALCGLSPFTLALDREAFTFTKYDLNVQIEPEQQRLAVRGEITLRNDSQVAQKNIVLQISSSLTWRSIQVNGKPVQFVSQTYTSDIDHTGALSEAIVTLPEEVPPRGVAELEIGYEGIVPLDATRLTRIGVPEETAKHADWDRIGISMTAMRGIGYVAWYPIATEAANLSEGNSVFETAGHWRARETQTDMKIRLSYGGDSIAPPVLLCNGKTILIQYEEMGAAYHATSDCTFFPLAGVTPFLALGHHEGLVQPAVTVSYLPEHKSIAKDYAASVNQVLPFVAEWFSDRTARIQVVELADPLAPPFESGKLLLTPFHSTDLKTLEGIVVHQLTHAAFSSPRPWIDEGVAHFLQALLRERQDGRQAALDFMGLHRPALVAGESTLRAGQDVSARESLVNTYREGLYRTKAMYVWWMLRDLVGDKSLKDSLADYHSDQDKEPSYMQRLIEAQSKKDLEWFFDDWVYRDQGLPDFRVVSVYPRKTMKNTYLVTVTVENLGNAAAEVPVVVHFTGLEARERILVKGKSQASVRLETTRRPDEVTVNDGSVPESDVSNNTFKVDAATDIR